KSGPLLVVANHQGWADGFLLAAAFSLQAPIRLIADRDGTLGVWWHRVVISSVGLVIPIDRKAAGADRLALAATIDALRRGATVALARAIHDDLAALAPGSIEARGPKPLRWLTNLF